MQCRQDATPTARPFPLRLRAPTSAATPSPALPRTPPIPKRQRNHRTAQDPWEASIVDGPEHEVDKILSSVYKKGLKMYNVLWKAGDQTEEPEANLVGASELVRECNEARTSADRAEKAKIVETRALRKAEKLAADTEAKAAATAAALAAAIKESQGSEDCSTSKPMPEDVVVQTGRLVLRMHRNKTGVVWQVFDLLEEKPRCTIGAAPGAKCGAVPSTTGGTSNYWQHLYHHHRATWLKFKDQNGDLTPAGQQQIEAVRIAMAARMAASVDCTKKPALPASVRVTLDRLAAEWVVDEDQSCNAAEKPAFKKTFLLPPMVLTLAVVALPSLDMSQSSQSKVVTRPADSIRSFWTMVFASFCQPIFGPRMVSLC